MIKNYYVELTEICSDVQFDSTFLFSAALGEAEGDLFTALMGWRTDAVCQGDSSDDWFIAGDVAYRVDRVVVISDADYAILLPLVGAIE